MPSRCNVINCHRQAVSKGLCDTHRKQVSRHGEIGTLRPNDWGRRHKHPAYNAWRTLHRVYAKEIPESWHDFWTFLSEVPEKPKDGKTTATREYPDQPWSASNFYWKSPVTTLSYREDRATYMREYQRARRSDNPNYNRKFDLKRHYGVTPEWYDARLSEQNGVCAICKKPETTVISGRLIQLSVDHCHDSGKVRGLLCRPCNQAIGSLKHDTKLLLSAIVYLETHHPKNPSEDLV